ncbi:MAG: hypothetical protein ACJAVT_000935 [Yoonia sp.]|jgi:hypothetical protein
MFPRAELRRGLNKFSSNVKRERVTRDRCQQIIMQQVMMQILFINKMIAGEEGCVQRLVLLKGFVEKSAFAWKVHAVRLRQS